MTALTFLLLAAVFAAEMEDAFFHQDDGCAVEIHCLACRLTIGSTAVLTNAAVCLGPRPDIVGTAPLPAAPQNPPAAQEARRPRGPPSA